MSVEGEKIFLAALSSQHVVGCKHDSVTTKKKKTHYKQQNAPTFLPLLGLPCLQPAQTINALICPCRVLQSEEFHIYTQYCTNYPR